MFALARRDPSLRATMPRSPTRMESALPFYLGGGVFAGSCDVVAHLSKPLQRELAGIGLELNFSKCEVFAPAGQGFMGSAPGLDGVAWASSGGSTRWAPPTRLGGLLLRPCPQQRGQGPTAPPSQASMWPHARSSALVAKLRLIIESRICRAGRPACISAGAAQVAERERSRSNCSPEASWLAATSMQADCGVAPTWSTTRSR